jgi:hypothetical protein
MPPDGDDIEEHPDSPLQELIDTPSLEDVEPGPSAMRFWRLALGLLIVATIAAVVGLGSGGRASSAVDAVGDAAGWTGNRIEAGFDEAGDLWDGWTTRLQELAADEPPPVLEAIEAPEGSASLLLAVTDEAGDGVAYALLASSPEGEHSVVLFPPGLLSIVPGYGEFSLAEASLFEDQGLAALTVSNLLGIRIDEVVALGPGDVEALLTGPLAVDLPVELLVAEDDGSRVLADVGLAERPPSLVEAILSIEGEGGQLDWLQRQAAVWDALLAEIVENPDLATRFDEFVGPGSEAGSILGAAAADPDRMLTVIPVTRISLSGGEGFLVSNESADTFIADRLSHLVLREGERPRVEVLNGNGRTQATRLVAESLVNRGFRVIKTDNADAFTYEESQIIAQGRENRGVAEEALALLGTGELVLELRAPSGVVDISIIVGLDIPSGEG